jgi:hypothetical protein
MHLPRARIRVAHTNWEQLAVVSQALSSIHAPSLLQYVTKGRAGLALLRFGSHMRKQQHIADRS